jgi:hypothetical protein
MHFMVNKIWVLIRPKPVVSGLYYKPAPGLKTPFCKRTTRGKCRPFPLLYNNICFSLNLCTIRMASIVYRGHLVPFGIVCASVICPSVRFMISGSAPKFIRSVLLGFRWVRLWLSTSSRTISRRHLSISVVILRILIMILRPVSAEWKVPSTTEYKFGFRFAYVMDVIWNSLRIQTVIFYNVWRSCYFEYLLP